MILKRQVSVYISLFYFSFGAIASVQSVDIIKWMARLHTDICEELGGGRKKEKEGDITHDGEDDQRWKLLDLLARRPRKAPEATRYHDRSRGILAVDLWGEKERYDLRKTARGASSPAKPALHIPDLVERS